MNTLHLQVYLVRPFVSVDENYKIIKLILLKFVLLRWNVIGEN